MAKYRKKPLGNLKEQIKEDLNTPLQAVKDIIEFKLMQFYRKIDRH